MKIIYFLFIFLSYGCSNFFDSWSKVNDESIAIKTPYVKNADCRIYDGSSRKWRLRKTPGVVTVYKGYPPLTISCHKKGFKDTVLQIYDNKSYRPESEADEITSSFFSDFLDIIPAISKGVATVIYDPFVSLSKEYPREVVIWMEPEQWSSEDFRRSWSYNKSLSENKILKQKEAIDRKRIQEYYKKKENNI